MSTTTVQDAPAVDATIGYAGCGSYGSSTPGLSTTRPTVTSTATALHEETVAAYGAKYATKAAADLATGDAGPNPHLRRLRHVVGELAVRATLAAQTGPDGAYKGWGNWVDMLGFNGHFASKSRRYSTTLGRLRQARRDYTRHRHLRPLSDPAGVIELDADLDEVETTLMVGVLAVRRYQLAHHRRRRPRVGRPRPRRLTRPPQASAAAGRTGEAVHSSASP